MTGEESETYTLSTGQTVEVPMTFEARITGAVFSAPLDELREMLPEGLRPLRLTPRKGGITVLSVDYERIGDDVMEPYNEVSIQIPAVEEGTRTIPVLSGLTRFTSGYVSYMPVTTEPAKALGREIWGYPKEVADISIEHGSERTETVVRAGGERVLSLEVRRPPTVPLRLSGYSYTQLDEALQRENTVIKGQIGAWPLSQEVRLTLRRNRHTEPYYDLDLSGRRIWRIASDCVFSIYPPTSHS